MIRLAVAIGALACLAGCAVEGSAEASGNTKSLYEEIPPPKNPPSGRVPAGNSLLKGQTPGDMSKTAPKKGG